MVTGLHELKNLSMILVYIIFVVVTRTTLCVVKNNGFYMKILCYVLKFPEFSGELQPAKKFSSPTPAKSDFLLSAEISGDLLEMEISTTLLYITMIYLWY